jgi:hypothetical protein
VGTAIAVHYWGLHKDENTCEQVIADSADTSYIFANGRMRPDSEANIAAGCSRIVAKTQVINQLGR